MTKRKASPQKRGRKPIPDLWRRIVLTRWEEFEPAAKLGPEMRFHRFCTTNRVLLRRLGINVGEYQVLKNLLTRARKSRKEAAAARMARKVYLKEAEKFALGLRSSFRPLGDRN